MTPDPFAELLGLVPAPQESIAPLASDATVVFPTRRELRAQYSATSARSTRRATARTARRRTTRRPLAPIAAAAYAPPAKPVRTSKTRAVVTIGIVAGLFATAAIPAYAVGTPQSVISPDVTSVAAGTALSVSAEAKLSVGQRGAFTATTPADLAQQRSDFAKQANYDNYMKSGAQEAGDDYPWFSELANTQGGGLSPLNYFYRECVDFVAWRLNRDAGSTSAPFLYDWHTLTPNGGNASQWANAWKLHGWKTSTVPVAGSVAWFAGNHVAYVNHVNDDGTVLIEEYNYANDHQYGQRTIPATDVALFLYAPPR